MIISKLRVTCLDCKHVFDADVVTNAPVSVAIASMQAVRCPECHGANCGLGGEKSEGKPGLDRPIEERAAWWLESGDTGISSKTIYSAFTKSHCRNADYPYDPSDFGRCRRLLDLIPEWRPDLTPVVHAYPWFFPFIQNWDEMDRLFDLESPSGSCPKLYALMKSLRKQSDAIRGKR